MSKTVKQILQQADEITEDEQPAEDQVQEEELEDNDSNNCGWLSNYFVKSVLMIPISVLILYSQAWMEDWGEYDTESEWFLNNSYRWNVFTQFFPRDNCVVFNLLVIWGFFYVTWVNLGSSKPWESFYLCSVWTLPQLIFISNGAFFWVVQFTMRASKQLSGFCDGLTPPATSYVSECAEYTTSDIFDYNIYFLGAFFAGLQFTQIHNHLLSKLPGFINAFLLLCYIGGSCFFTYGFYMDNNYEYNYVNGWIKEEYWYVIGSYILIQQITNFGYVRLTHPLFFYAMILLPLPAGHQIESNTMMIGLQCGLIVEGMARKGLTIWMPSNDLTFYWTQVEYCVEPPKEEAEDAEEGEDQDENDPFINDFDFLDFNNKSKRSSQKLQKVYNRKAECTVYKL